MKKRTKLSKYDTTLLREKIRRKMTYNAFYDKVSAQTGIKPATIGTHVTGQCVPSYEEIECYAKILKMNADDIAALYNSKKAVPKASVSSFYGKPFNYDALEEAREKAGLSKKKVCKIIGIADSSFRHWKVPTSKGPNSTVLRKLCTLLGCTPESLYFDKSENASVAEPKEAESKPASEPSLAGFKTIETLNVIEMIKIINENVLLLAKNMDVMARLNASQNATLSDAVTGLGKEVTDLNEAIEMLAKKASGGRPVATPPQKSDHVILLDSKKKETAAKMEAKTEEKKQEEEKKVEKDNLIREYKHLAGQYNADDDFDTYRVKINRMVSLITHATNETFKHTIHKYYKEMTLVYGVVYRQLEKEYFDKYQKKHRYGSTELLYENEIFREIFYHLISDKLGEIVAAA